MNENNFDQDTKDNGSENFGIRILNHFKELEVFVILVIMGVALIILLGLFSDSKILQMTGLLSYLAATLLFLVFYSAVTTRIINASISYRLRQVIKRFIDIVLAFLMLNFLSPLFLLLALAVRIESPGPVFFYTIHLGQFRKPIRVLKFRTMHLAPRGELTKTGNFLRQTHLNELPQLWNVLIGEMSLVGPSLRHPDDSAKALDSDGKILTVRPGITGLSQISEASKKDSVGLDLQYVQNWSLALDLRILFKIFMVAFQDFKSA
jgi:lipopolysaccharide/colanic/teichoic acid biosynthesis glycosyltransferase